MTWFRIDDGFHSHPKVARLFDGDHAVAAIGLWTLAGSWCAHELTDGLIPFGFVKRLGLNRKIAAELLRVGLWEPDPNGYRIHDYLHYNPSREQILQERAEATARKQRSRAGLPHRKDAPRPGLTRDKRVSQALSQPESQGESHPESQCDSPPPSRVSHGGVAGPPDPDPGFKNSTTTTARVRRRGDDESEAVAIAIGEFQAIPSLFPLTLSYQPHEGGKWRAHWAWIGEQPADQRSAVAATVSRSERLRANPEWATPKHIRDYWALYSAGKEPGFKPANDNNHRRPSGPSEVGKPEEFGRGTIEQ